MEENKKIWMNNMNQADLAELVLKSKSESELEDGKPKVLRWKWRR